MLSSPLNVQNSCQDSSFHSIEPLANVEEKENVSEDVLELAYRFDNQILKLKQLCSVRHSSELDPEDVQVGRVAVEGIRETCNLIKLKLDELEAQLDTEKSCSDLWAEFRQLAGLESSPTDPLPTSRIPKPSTPKTGSASLPISRFVTPSSQNRANKPSGSSNRTPNRKGYLDFDAFPSTPTLEQLGLSGNTLALVGLGTRGKASGMSNIIDSSDTEAFETLTERSFLSGTSMSTPHPTNLRSSSTFAPLSELRHSTIQRHDLENSHSSPSNSMAGMDLTTSPVSDSYSIPPPTLSSNLHSEAY